MLIESPNVYFNEEGNIKVDLEAIEEEDIKKYVVEIFNMETKKVIHIHVSQNELKYLFTEDFHGQLLDNLN